MGARPHPGHPVPAALATAAKTRLVRPVTGAAGLAAGFPSPRPRPAHCVLRTRGCPASGPRKPRPWSGAPPARDKGAQRPQERKAGRRPRRGWDAVPAASVSLKWADRLVVRVVLEVGGGCRAGTHSSCLGFWGAGKGGSLRLDLGRRGDEVIGDCPPPRGHHPLSCHTRRAPCHQGGMLVSPAGSGASSGGLRWALGETLPHDSAPRPAPRSARPQGGAAEDGRGHQVCCSGPRPLSCCHTF